MKDSYIERAIRYLLINMPFVPDISLYYGQMGGVLFFYEYAKYTNQEIYREFAGELLDIISKRMSLNIPVNFAEGICGIGWGIEYLFQHKFITGNVDDILSDIDKKIEESSLIRMRDRSIKTGLAGILVYVITRLESFDRKGGHIPFTSSFLNELHDAVHKVYLMQNHNCQHIDRLDNYINGKIDYGQKPIIMDLISENLVTDSINDGNIKNMNIGMADGLTGMLFRKIFA